jgi:hypothetical protein
MGNSGNRTRTRSALRDERIEWDIGMNTVLYFSANGAVFETQAFGKADLDQLIQSRHLQHLTSGNGQFDFWFSPTTPRCQRRVNTKATELLMATSSFTAKSVPLLHGCVVVASHDHDGDLDGLSWQQLDSLMAEYAGVTARQARRLGKRVLREDARRKAEPTRKLPAPAAPRRETVPLAPAA